MSEQQPKNKPITMLDAGTCDSDCHNLVFTKSDGVVNEIIKKKWKSSDSFDSDFVKLDYAYTTPIFDFLGCKRSYEPDSDSDSDSFASKKKTTFNVQQGVLRQGRSNMSLHVTALR